MSYTIIIILIAAIIVAGIAASAVQQHNERKEALKREEVNKHKTIMEEADEALSAAKQMPVSNHLIHIVRTRSLQALVAISQQVPSPELSQRINEIKQSISQLDLTAAPPSLNGFQLPSNDKQIIKYIQTVKKLRNIVRLENAKGKVSSELFKREDKALEKLQLRVNIETLSKRASEAATGNMHGSARQYIGKALKALKAHKPQDEYTQSRIEFFEGNLNEMDDMVKQAQLKQVAEAQKAKDDDIDTIFAPKKKW